MVLCTVGWAGPALAETLTWTNDIPNGGWPGGTLGPHTTSAGVVCNGSRNFTGQFFNPMGFPLPAGTPRTTGFLNSLILGMQNVPAGQGTRLSQTFTQPIENLAFSISDIDGTGGGWRDRIIIQAFDGATPRTVNVACAAGPGGCPATVINNPPFGNNQIDAGTTPTGFTAANGRWNVTIAGPVSMVNLLYQNHTVATSTTQFIAVSQLTYDCTLIGVSKVMTNVNGAGQSPYQVTIDYTFENFGEVALTNLSALEDLVATFDNPAGPPGVGPLPGNFNVTGIAVTVAGGTVSVNPGFDGNADTQLLGAGSGLAPGESATIRVSLDVFNYATYNNQVTVSATTPVGGTITDQSTNGADPDGGDGDNNPDELVISVLDTSTLPVSLSYLRSEITGRDLVLEWATDVEFGNLGFEFYAGTSLSDRAPISGIVATRGGNATAPQTYRFETDTQGPPPSHVWVADVGRDGKRTWHGPYRIGQTMGRKPDRDWDIDWSLASPPEATAQRKSGALGLHVVVDQTGMHRIDLADLLNSGLDLGGHSPSELVLTLGGAAVPVVLNGDPAVFGPDTSLDFLGQAVDSLYTRERIYELRFDSAQARPAALNRTAPGRILPIAHHRAVARHAPQRIYDFSSSTDDPWRADELLYLGSPVSRDYSVVVRDPSPQGSPPMLKVTLHGGTDVTTPPETPPDPTGCGGTVLPPAPGRPHDHCVRVLVDGVLRGELVFDGLTVGQGEFVLDDLPAGPHTIRLEVPGDHGYPFDLIRVESLEIEYAQSLVADAGRLDFSLPGGGIGAGDRVFADGLEIPRADAHPGLDANLAVDAVSVAGLGAGETPVAYALDGHVPIRLLGASTEHQQSGDHVLLLPLVSPAGRYWVSTPAALLRPRLQPAPAVADIRTQGEYLMITHPVFAGETTRLADIHRGRGLTVDVMNVEAIYHHYSDGVVDPGAIRAYIADEVNQRRVRQVLLVGGDSYDYLDHLGLGSQSYIPTLYRAVNEFVRYTPADPLFGDVDADGVPDVPLGRLPVRSVSELALLIDKIDTFLASGLAANGYFVADAAQVDSDYGEIADDLMARLPPDWGLSHTHRDDLPSNAATRQAVIDGISAGPALTAFLGHSGPRTWFRDPSFDLADIPSLGNEGQAGTIMQWGCWNGYFVDPGANTLAHRFLFDGPHGAVSVLGAAALSETRSETAFAELLMDTLADHPSMTLGEAVLAAKQSLADQPADYRDVVIGWVLLGDPALPLVP